MTSRRATFIGFFAVLLWSLLAVLTVKTEPVPPLQLNAMAFFVGGVLGILWLWRASQPLTFISQTSWRVWALGIGGLFGYHFLYFSALRLAPAAEAGLIAYLWPLLIVLFSGLLPGESLKTGHVVGALISFAGAALILLGGGAEFALGNLPGYALAAFCALTWSGYSVLSRRARQVPTGIVAFFCLATAALSFVAHLMFEVTLWPSESTGWAAIILLGLGPVGLAFYVWDVGVKHGDIQMLGIAAYCAPLLSTLILIAAGIARPSWQLVGAAILITLGALIAGNAARFRKSSAIL